MTQNIKNLAAILFIAVIFSAFGTYKFITGHKPEPTYKVLRIIEGDKFYIDLNKNDLEDKDELFHLNFVNSFPANYSRKTSEYAKKFDLSIVEILSLGYGAKEFSRNSLEGKFISFGEQLEDYNPEYGYRFAKIIINGEDFAKILLQNGFGFSYNPQNYDYYKKFENPKRIKENLEELILKEIMVVDENNNTYHELNCPETLKIKNPVLMPFKDIPKNFKKCEHCYLKRDFDLELENQVLKIESPEPNLRVGQIELFLINPLNYFAPTKRCRTNVCQAIIKNINAAKSEIGFAIYGFEKQDEIFDALKAAKARGVKIYGVVDTDSKGKYAYEDSQKFLKEFSLIKDDNAALMHNKFLIFDNQKVISGTMNISATGTGGYNSNTAVLINSSEIASIYKSELEQMINCKFQKKKSAATPMNLNLGGAKVSVYFSPKSDIYKNAIKPGIINASSEILVSAFYLTHKELIEDLIAAQKRGVKIKIIIDATSATNPSSKHKNLREAKIPVKIENWGGKNHEKNIAIDGKIFIIGSANFSQSGVSKNDENILIIENAQITRAYREHFMKLYNSIDDKYLKVAPHAESFESKNSCFDGVDNDFDGKIDSKDEGCKRRVLL